MLKLAACCYHMPQRCACGSLQLIAADVEMLQPPAYSVSMVTRTVPSWYVVTVICARGGLQLIAADVEMLQPPAYSVSITRTVPSWYVVTAILAACS